MKTIFNLLFIFLLIKSEVTIYDNRYCLEFLDYLGYTELEVDMDDFYDLCLKQTQVILKEHKFLDDLLDKIDNQLNYNIYEFYDI